MITTTPHDPGPSHDQYDVVVVGARAAGAATAMLLARRGLRVLCVDRAAKGADTLSTHALARAGVMLLQDWGLIEDLRAAGTPVASTVEFHYGGDPVLFDTSGEDEVGGLLAPRRTVLDPILVDAAVRAGAEVRHRVTVSSLLIDGSGRVSGVSVGRGSTDRRIHARWVVGADGVRSFVAREVGARTLSTERVSSTVTYALWRGLPDDTLANHFDVPGRAVGFVPTNAGQTNVWIALRPEEYQRKLRGDLRGAYHQMLAEHPVVGDRLASATCLGGYRSFPGQPGFLRESHGPGWALVGDAGYFKDPLSAHGITDALVGAELLSDAIGDVLQGKAGSASALADFQDRRDAFAAELMPPVARIASLGLDGTDMMREFRSLAAALRHEAEALARRRLAGV